jgi:hypothetical protein
MIKTIDLRSLDLPRVVSGIAKVVRQGVRRWGIAARVLLSTIGAMLADVYRPVTAIRERTPNVKNRPRAAPPATG